MRLTSSRVIGVEQRPLGETGLNVSVLGFGAGRIGGPDISDQAVDRLVGAVLDAGINLIDTARSYGLSEERLGRAVAPRRHQVLLSTKVGYGVPEVPDWTGPCITAGVDAALGRLRTDHLDLVHLHSCGLYILERRDVVDALVRAVAAGKVRVAAYAGEGMELIWAIRSGAFGAVQCSVSLVDQQALELVPEASARGIGVLAKRALGNAPWRFEARPPEGDVAEAWDRFGALALDRRDIAWPALFLRFAAFAPGVSSALVGTADVEHLAEAVTAVNQGPLEEEHVATMRAAFKRAGRAWSGRI